jgi:hypothetical protein
MDRTADLDAALSFVIARVEQQATLSGEPLNEEQRLLLNYLPSSSPVVSFPDAELPSPIPRNINLERLCALVKAAYQQDRQVNPSLDWDFVFAVFTLNRHPMGGLLQWAGMKPRRPRWDWLRLTIAALLPVVAVVLIALNPRENLFQSVGIGSGCVAIMLLLFFASRRIEKQRIEEEVERCRLGFRAVSTVAK